MNLNEIDFSELSNLRYQIFTTKLHGDISPTALVLKFSGEYGHGSGGNGDAAFMRAITLAAISAWDAGAVIFDLRELDYEWGNDVWDVFGDSSIPPFTLEEPQALIVSDRCRKGFSTCAGMVPEMFDDMESAIDYVRQERLKRRDQYREERQAEQEPDHAESLLERLRSFFNGQ